jgi:ATP-dependent DNA helicase RecQ
VVADVSAQLGAGLTTVRGPLRREGLALSTIRLDRQAERLAWLAEAVPTFDGSGIIYCLTVRDTENVAAFLSERGLEVLPYHGNLDAGERVDAEQRLLSNDLDALVATVALGMGYDKPDLGFVVHFQSPGSPVGYYQQVGRAGRALESSRAVLLRGTEDEQIQNYFIERAFAEQHIVQDVIKAFDKADGPESLIHLQVELNVKKATLDQVAKQLDVDGALRRISAQTYERTLLPWDYPSARIDSVTEARRAEQQAMVDYYATTDCRMRFLTALLDDPAPHPCGICDNCTGVSAALDLPVELVAAAEDYLRKQPISLTPRKQYYNRDAERTTKIPADEQLEAGRVLAMWGDAGWGQLIRDGKQRDGHFDDQLVEALTQLIREWAPDPAPVWATSVPSTRHSRLVPSLAERLAVELGLQFLPIVERAADRPVQREQQNSMHQQLNVAEAFAITGAVPEGSCLLVDDVVDSGWTMTEVGRLLRRSGSGVVYPVVLASSAGRQ